MKNSHNIDSTIETVDTHKINKTQNARLCVATVNSN